MAKQGNQIEQSAIQTQIFDKLPKSKQTEISTYVVAKTTRQIGDGTLGINDPIKIEEHMLREVERLAGNPEAFKLEKREEELLVRLSNISPELLQELKIPNKFRGGVHVDHAPKKPCVNTPGIICVDGIGYTKG
jgi:hypothetical protein